MNDSRGTYKSLIDLTYIPSKYKEQILQEFDNVAVAPRGGHTYFINNS